MKKTDKAYFGDMFFYAIGGAALGVMVLIAFHPKQPPSEDVFRHGFAVGQQAVQDCDAAWEQVPGCFLPNGFSIESCANEVEHNCNGRKKSEIKEFSLQEQLDREKKKEEEMKKSTTAVPTCCWGGVSHGSAIFGTVHIPASPHND